MALDKTRTLELIQRSLALRHKLKVHDSMPKPDNHDDLAQYSFVRWELEDELNAIEELIRDLRSKNVNEKKTLIAKQGPKKKSKKLSLELAREN